MLRKQQAMATVAARKTIVEGAVEIAHGALQRLGERGMANVNESFFSRFSR
jgi:hypothetical protein